MHLIEAINLISLLANIGLLIPIATLFLECLVAMLARQRTMPASGGRPAAVVLMPAHNEDLGIAATINALLPQLAVHDQLIVIADNCTDATARVARQAGATVIERTDPDRRGKGYALDFGVRFVEKDPPAVVVVVDADCQLAGGSLDTLVQTAASTGRPVQAVYLLDPPLEPGPRDLISGLAFLVKNLVRPLGLKVLGVPCLLTGTGMAFPWSLIQSAPLATGNIVEDMVLGLNLALDGHPPLLCDAARVSGQLAHGTAAAMTQRKRWEHGHLRTILTQAPRLLLGGMQRGRLGLIAIALDLCVPPLSLLLLLWAVVFLATACMRLAGFGMLPLVIAALGGVLMLSAILLAWVKFGRKDYPFRLLLLAPLYAAWKVPLYVGFIFRRQRDWVRTARQGPINH